MRRKYRVKKTKSILKSRLVWAGILSMVVSGGIFYLFVFSPLFKIKTVSVRGNERINSQELEGLVLTNTEKKIFGFPAKNILLADPKPLETMLTEKYPLVKKAKIKKQLPDSLLVEIEERKAIGVWCKDDNCFALDKNGVVFEAAINNNDELIVKSKQPKSETKLGQNVIDKKNLEQILIIQKTTREKAGIEVREFVFFEGEARLNARTTEEWQVFFDLNQDINWQLVRLELVLEKELPQEKRQGLEYIDLRFSKVYYK